MLSFELRQIAGMAAGTYFVVRDNSTPSNIQVFENLRVIPISSMTGPTNQLVIFEEGDVASFDRLYGKTNRTQEKLGNFSVSSARQMISDGPTAVINVRSYSDIDTVQGSFQNLNIAPQITAKDLVYSTLVQEDGFWVVKPKNIADVIGTEELLNFANVGNSDVSYFTVFAEKADIDEITGEGNETFADMDIEVDEFPALVSAPNTKFADTFVSVYIFKNNFLDSNVNEFYGDLFENGQISIDNLERLSRVSQSGFAQKLTGTLIPFVKSEFGIDISIDDVVNSAAMETGLYAYINSDVLETETDGLIDLFDKNSLGYLSQLSALNNAGGGLVLGLNGFVNDTTTKLNKLSYQVNPLLGLGDLSEHVGAMQFNNSVDAGVGINNYVKNLTIDEDFTNQIVGSGFDAFSAALSVEERIFLNTNIESIVANSLYQQTTENFDITGLDLQTNKLHTIIEGNLFKDFLSKENLFAAVVPNVSNFETIKLIQKLNVDNTQIGTVVVPKMTVAELIPSNNPITTTQTIYTAFMDNIIANFNFATTAEGFTFNTGTAESDFGGLLLPGLEFVNLLTGARAGVNFREVIAALNNGVSNVDTVGISADVLIEYANGEFRTFNNVIEYNYNSENKLNINETDNRELFFLNGDISNNAINWSFSFNINPLFVKKQLIGKINTTLAGTAINTVDTTISTIAEADIYPAESNEYAIVESTLTNINFNVLNENVNSLVNASEPGFKFVNANGLNNFKLTKTTLTGLKIREDQLYNGSPSRQNEILDVLNMPSLVKGFKDTRGVRYFIDGFKTFIEAGYKYQFNNLVLSLDKCNVFTRAIVNEPFIEDLQRSINPSFKDAVGDTRTLKLDRYLETGGNPQTSSIFLSKPNTAPEMVYYYGSEEVNRNAIRPIAPIVSKLFIDKQRPWDIVANTTGVLSGVANIAINPDEPTRRAMERFGWNPIIKKGAQFVVFGDYSGNNAFKKRKALSFVSNSELLAYIKQELFNMSLDESFKKGTANDFIRFETQVTNFMDGLALQNAIRANPTVQLNFENNTPDVLAAGIKLVNIEYVNFQTLDKVVFALDLS